MTRKPAQQQLFTASASDADTTNTTNFTNNMQLPVHRWFRYSAGFSAEWVQSVVADAGDPSSVRVLDPFAGSGTTLLSAQRAGVASVGLDSHPFVSRVGRAKLLWPADYEALQQRASDALVNFRPCVVEDPPRLLTTCYMPDVLGDLLGLREELRRSHTDSPIDQLLWLAFVAIVRPVSHVGTAQWQYVLPNKRKKASLGVREAFTHQIDMMVADMRQHQMAVPEPVTAEYLGADARDPENLPQDWATLVVCSPPYANNYDYADATRLEQTVLGEVSSWADLKQVRDQLLRSCSQHMVRYDPTIAFEDPILIPIIGELVAVYERLANAREDRGGRKAYHHMIAAYFHDLATIWMGLRRACTAGSKVCFVIGDSAPYGVHVPVERWLGELAVGAGFHSWYFEKVRDRNIKWKNRKHRVPLVEGRLWVTG